MVLPEEGDEPRLGARPPPSVSPPVLPWVALCRHGADSATSQCNIHPDISLRASPSQRSSWQPAQPATAALPWQGGTGLSQTPPWLPCTPGGTGGGLLPPFPFRTISLPFTISPPASSWSGLSALHSRQRASSASFGFCSRGPRVLQRVADTCASSDVQVSSKDTKTKRSLGPSPGCAAL